MTLIGLGLNDAAIRVNGLFKHIVIPDKRPAATAPLASNQESPGTRRLEHKAAARAGASGR